MKVTNEQPYTMIIDNLLVQISEFGGRNLANWVSKGWRTTNATKIARPVLFRCLPVVTEWGGSWLYTVSVAAPQLCWFDVLRSARLVLRFAARRLVTRYVSAVRSCLMINPSLIGRHTTHLISDRNAGGASHCRYALVSGQWLVPRCRSCFGKTLQSPHSWLFFTNFGLIEMSNVSIARYKDESTKCVKSKNANFLTISDGFIHINYLYN